MKGVCVKGVISSNKATVILLFIYTVVLALATVVEKNYGTPTAKAWIYFSPLFFLLQLLMVVNFIMSTVTRKRVEQKRWGFILTHFSFLIILLGALTSHIIGEEGILHIREGDTQSHMMVYGEDGEAPEFVELPFQIELIDFTLKRYPGSSSPSSYESLVNVFVDGEKREERIFMNNILDIKGYRLFQSSYDKDELGTVLLVNKDAVGRVITYWGYFFLFLGLLLSLLDKRSRFGQLYVQLSKFKVVSVFFFVMFANVAMGNKHQEIDYKKIEESILKYKVDDKHLNKFNVLPIQSLKGRMMPISTFSSEILRKLHSETEILGLNSTQFLLSLYMNPNLWIYYPLIANENKQLSDEYELSADYFAYMEIFDEDGNYKFEKEIEEAYSKDASQRTRQDKDLLKLDEKINIMHQLLNRQLLHIFPLPNDSGNRWLAPGDDLTLFNEKDSMFVGRIFEWYVAELYAGTENGDYSKADEVLEMIQTFQQAKATKVVDISKRKMKAEVISNEWDLFRWVKMGYLICGGILLVLSFVSLGNSRSRIHRGEKLLLVLIALFVLVQISGIGIRWFISGYAPWSNSYETMVYISLISTIVGLIFVRKSIQTTALGTLFGGVILFVSSLNWMDPQITPLVPVLQSPWLMFHVAVIVAAYGFFGLSALLGLTNLVLMCVDRKQANGRVLSKIKELTIINEMSLWVGLVLMTIGTFLGAIWANESWGRYWGWDPKETWALITMLVYVMVVHLRFWIKNYNTWFFNLLSLISIASVLMTYFGVNYFLSGMHSYGQRVDLTNVTTVLVVIVVFVSLLGYLSYKGFKSASTMERNI